MQKKPVTQVLKILVRLLHLCRPYKSIIILLLFLTLISTLLGLVRPVIYGQVFDQVILRLDDSAQQRLNYLIIFSLIFLVAEVLNRFISYVYSVKSESLGEIFSFDLRSRLFDHLLNLSGSFYDETKPGVLSERIDDEVNTLSGFAMYSLFTVIVGFLSFLGLLAIMLYVSVSLTLVALITAPLYYLVIRLIGRRARKQWDNLIQMDEQLSSFVYERLANIKISQLFNKQQDDSRNFADSLKDRKNLAIDLIQTYAKYSSILGFIGSATIVLILLYGGIISIKGDVKPGQLVTFIACLGHLWGSLHSLARVNYVMQSITSAGERIFELFDTKPQITEIADTKDLASSFDIAVEDLSFNYKEKEVLKDINLEIKEGEKIGIAGKTGAGKSTLARLIVRFYDPTKGSIKISGVDLRGLKLVSLRNTVTLIMQESFFFNDTVRNNLLYANSQASMDMIKTACTLTCGNDFIEKLPNGYDTVIGEKGHKLSEGERQRLALSRALLRNPSILILDEATSALDIKTEKTVLENIFRQLNNKTLIFISHRDSVLTTCERVYEIRDKKLFKMKG